MQVFSAHTGKGSSGGSIVMIDSFTGLDAFLHPDFLISVRYDNMLYPSVSHAYEASKTQHIGMRIQIANSKSPWVARQMAIAFPVDRDEWDEKRVRRMELLTRNKFDVPLMAAMLLATGYEDLIYRTKNDSFWGVVNGRGENNLGEILMQTRHEIRSKHSRCSK